MSLFQKIFLSVDILLSRKKNFILTVLVLLVSLFIFEAATTLMLEQTFALKKFRSYFAVDTEKLYTLKVLSMPEPDMEEEIPVSPLQNIYYNMLEMECVKSSARYAASVCAFDELWQSDAYAERMERAWFQTNSYQNIGNRSYIIYTDAAMFDYLGIEMPEITSWDSKTEKEYPLLVGSALKDFVTVGQLLHTADLTYEVVGILPQGTVWPTNSYIEVSYGNAFCLDYGFLAPLAPVEELYSYSYAHAIYMQLDASPVLAEQQLSEMAKEFDVSLVIRSVEERLEEPEQTIQYELSLYRRLFGVAFFLCVLTSAAAATIVLLLRREELAVYYISGITNRELLQMELIGNGIKVLLAAVCAYSAGAVLMMYEVESMQVIYYGECWKYVIVLSCIVYLLMTVVPFLYIWTKKPVELLQRED